MALVGCRDAPGAGTLHARVLRTPPDSTAFDAPAAGRPCAGGRGVLLEGVNGGSGVLAWVHGPTGVTRATYPILAGGDTVTPRGAVVAVRYLNHGVARGFALDSGVLTVTAAGPRYRAHLDGKGLEPSTASRPLVQVTFDSVLVGRDTIVCGGRI